MVEEASGQVDLERSTKHAEVANLEGRMSELQEALAREAEAAREAAAEHRLHAAEEARLEALAVQALHVAEMAQLEAMVEEATAHARREQNAREAEVLSMSAQHSEEVATLEQRLTEANSLAEAESKAREAAFASLEEKIAQEESMSATQPDLAASHEAEISRLESMLEEASALADQEMSAKQAEMTQLEARMAALEEALAREAEGAKEKARDERRLHEVEVARLEATVEEARAQAKEEQSAKAKEVSSLTDIYSEEVEWLEEKLAEAKALAEGESRAREAVVASLEERVEEFEKSKLELAASRPELVAAHARAESVAKALYEREREVSLIKIQSVAARDRAAEWVGRLKARNQLLLSVFSRWACLSALHRLLREQAEDVFSSREWEEHAMDRAEVEAAVASQVARESLATGIDAYIAMVSAQGSTSVAQATTSNDDNSPSLASPRVRFVEPKSNDRTPSVTMHADYRNKVLVKFLVRVLEGGHRNEIFYMLDAVAKVNEMTEDDRKMVDDALTTFLRTPLQQLVSKTSEHLETFERSATKRIMNEE
ncbi:MAG: hypothetical protein SGPRY_010982 [Prymnesium sp.]